MTAVLILKALPAGRRRSQDLKPAPPGVELMGVFKPQNIEHGILNLEVPTVLSALRRLDIPCSTF
jgi:hypothetical protein